MYEPWNKQVVDNRNWGKVSRLATPSWGEERGQHNPTTWKGR
jgi:hypothetical protein